MQSKEIEHLGVHTGLVCYTHKALGSIPSTATCPPKLSKNMSNISKSEFYGSIKRKEILGKYNEKFKNAYQSSKAVNLEPSKLEQQPRKLSED